MHCRVDRTPTTAVATLSCRPALPSSTGCRRARPPRCYAGWWVTGLIIWFLERRDRFVRFHAAQSCVAFGAIAVVILSSAARGSVAVVHAVGVQRAAGRAVFAWVAGVVLWLVSIWKAANGADWRIPVAADIATECAQVKGRLGRRIRDQHRRLRAEPDPEAVLTAELYSFGSSCRLDRAVGVLELVLIPIHLRIAAASPARPSITSPGWSGLRMPERCAR